MGLENVRRVAVVGAGSMGNQIAQVAARVGGYQVKLNDINDEMVAKGLDTIRNTLQKHFVEKGKLTAEEMKAIVDRIVGTAKLEEAVKDADFVIEAAAENLAIKKDIFRRLDAFTAPHVILGTNTSGLNITDIASATKKPDKVVGMHFFNPVAVMKLVEVARGATTSQETTDMACEMCRKLGKEPIVCRDVGWGFLGNRAYGAMSDEAIQMVWERVASPMDIDRAMRLGFNLPMGPLELGDLTGRWGLRIASEEDRIREMGEARGRAHPMIRMMVRAGYPGGPGKKGIYDFWNDVLSKW
ncbi:MAG: 3-hydroxyacyl-CoA dehydrogenase family protein [Chloroflexi bacterium]|nr:3-hydroxyacyl-CoA dehydrogenase family protein [Chloroflexota bacterium]